MTEPIIKVVNVTKRFGRRTILSNINLDIRAGEIFGIIGMSGSGKTTLLNTMIGFLQPDAGDVLFKLQHLLSYKGDINQYRSVFSNPFDVKTQFGFSVQQPSIYPKLTAKENLEYFGKLYHLPTSIRKTNVEILLHLMKIYDSRNIPAESLSGGMQKRLDIACSLIHDPKVLILDEPTSNLDPLLRKEMWSFIKEINRKGTTIVLSSHFLDELEDFCDRVSILYDAKFITVGTPDEVKSYYSKEQEIRLKTSNRDYERLLQILNSKRTSLNISHVFVDEDQLVVYTTSAEKVLRTILVIIKELKQSLDDVTVEDPSLHEVLEIINKEHKEHKKR